MGVIVEFFRSIPVLILTPSGFQLSFAILGASSPFAAVVIGLVLYTDRCSARSCRSVSWTPARGDRGRLAIGMNKNHS